jgi:hypothetical protein
MFLKTAALYSLHQCVTLYFSHTELHTSESRTVTNDVAWCTHRRQRAGENQLNSEAFCAKMAHLQNRPKKRNPIKKFKNISIKNTERSHLYRVWYGLADRGLIPGWNEVIFLPHQCVHAGSAGVS